MKLSFAITVVILGLSFNAFAQSEKMVLSQLNQPVEIITDTWGVPHIYAKTEHDLFFSQGYQAVSDRLFQFEIFRRKATGTMAEVLGKRELKRDIGARLFSFKGNMEEELAHYHPHGKAIVEAFTEGVNAYIKQVLNGKAPMPVELKLLGIKPGYWTPAVVISRHNGLLTNVQDELATARLLGKIGEEKLRAISNFHPGSPDLRIDTAINRERLNDDVLALYNSFRTALVFKPEDITTSSAISAIELTETVANENVLYKQSEGSNNWAVKGSLAVNGFPMLANDPHRLLATPSLRYIVHLSAPGWNVIGGGEPILPGVSIGHNEYGAWGLTIFETDAEDLYVYKLNPLNNGQYFYRGSWKNFEKVTENIAVKNEPTQKVTLYYSIHGPVTFIDSLHHIGYAVKCGWLQKGCAPYLASLRMNQAKNWKEFQQACTYSNIPAENMVWADKKGDIGWQTVGITPIRNTHSGMVPVAGDGRYEWSGLLPIIKRPSSYNPAEGFICTANESRTPADYPYMNATGFSWSDSYRHDRIKEILSSKKKFSVEDMQQLQTDYLCIPARQLVPLLSSLVIKDSITNIARKMLLEWDYKLATSSVAATIYVEWEKLLGVNLLRKMGIDDLPDMPVEFNTKKMIDLLSKTNDLPGDNLVSEHNLLLVSSLQEAIKNLQVRLGENMQDWQYGQLKNKHVVIKHSLSGVVGEKLKFELDAGPIARGGGENTVNSTTNNMNQTHGASFRVIIDCADWDLMKGINTPGQSGDPASKHYKDLFELWGYNQYFPLYFSKAKVRSVEEKIVKLMPQ